MTKPMTVKSQLILDEDWNVKNGNTVLIPFDVVRGYLHFNYGNFYCNNLHTKFIYHNMMCAADLAKALEAWNATYDPLHNYDGKETVINLKSKGNEKTTESNTKTNNLTNTQTNNLTDTTTLTPDSTDNYTTSTATDGTKTTEYSSTYDNETLKKTGESVPVGGTKTEYHLKTTNQTTKTGTQTITDTGTVGDSGNNETEYKTTSITKDGKTYTAHEIEINELEKGGNLGVTTSQQMIQSEVDMRLNPLTMQYLNKFAMMYFWYSGGEIE